MSRPIAGLPRRGCPVLMSIAGLEREMTYGTAIGVALGVPYYECAEQQPRLPTCSSTRQLAWMLGCMLRLCIGVRTGGRLHPGQGGERLLKQRPHATSEG